MTGLVERGDLLLLGRDDMALLLLADADPDKGFLNIGLHDIGAVYSRGAYSRLVHEVLKIRSGETRRRAGDLSQIYVLAQWLISGMDLKDILAALHIRSAHRNLSVKTARAQDRRIQHVHSVGGRHDDDSLIDAESVHFHKKLVQCLLALVGAAQTCASAPCHCVDLVDEDYAGRILLGFVKHIPHAGRADADEHLYEIRTRNAEEWHACLAGDGLGQQCFASAGCAFQKHALRNAGADLRIFAGIFQEIDDLLEIII